MDKYLAEIWSLAQSLKVPRKAKEYLQKNVRTMFFEHIKQGDSKEIDGTKYIISMQANVENYTCREALFNVHAMFE